MKPLLADARYRLTRIHIIAGFEEKNKAPSTGISYTPL